MTTTATAAPLAFTAYQAVLLVTRLVGDKVVRRVGPVRTVRISGLVAIATVAEQVSHRAMFVLPLLLSPVLFLMASRFAPRRSFRRAG